jgi:spermidine synthase
MTEGGVFVTQSGACGFLNYFEVFTTIHSTCRCAHRHVYCCARHVLNGGVGAGRSSFKHVHPYAVDIPSFGCPWGFNLCYNSCAYPDAPNWDAETVNKRLVEVLGEKAAQELHNYDGETHRGLFCLPKVVRQGLAKETRIMTKDNPVFLT